MSEGNRSSHLACFDSFELNFQTGELCKGGQKIKLPEQSFRILAALLERPGELVRREDIKKKLWPNDTIVEFENSINAAIKKLRLALGDSADQPRYIETLARRGYRWKVPVEWVHLSPTEPPAPAASVAKPALRSFASHLIGKRVSHYRVLEILGGGGMGVVYKAEDIKLGRRVALKFLPEELANDTAAMERFGREARAASALNHPNICTIYEVEEHEGQPFIVMELLEGQTLREWIAEGDSQTESGKRAQIPLESILSVAIQTVEGLEAAHSKGIIHRDIKPANIFITMHRQVKILDFGLAKLQEPETADLQAGSVGPERPRQAWNPYLTLTRTGTAIGTAGYMSPEQLRGEKLDTRTDVFSFGLVLYEMATGQRAFDRETAPLLRTAILEHTPTPVRELNPEIPVKLVQIINQALQKNRESRYQTVLEIRSALESLHRETKPRRSLLRQRVLVAGAFTLLVAGSITLWFSTRRPSSPRALRDIKQRRLTANSVENWVLDSAISPNGKYLAYADRRAIQIKQLETGAVRTIPAPGTSAETELPPGSVGFAWFPDNMRLAFTVSMLVQPEPDSFIGGQCNGIWVLSLMGDAARKLRDDGCIGSISPDGDWIAFGRTGHRPDQFGNSVWLMGPNGERPHEVFEGDEHSRFDVVRWSPDGHRLVYMRSHETGDTSESVIQSRDLHGDPPVTMLSPSGYVGDFSWLPGGRLVYSLREPDRADCNFWERPVEEQTGEPRAEPNRLSNWAGGCMDNFSVTADGKRLAFHRHSGQESIYVADLLSDSRMTTPRHLTLSEDWNIASAWTADSRAVVFASDRNGTKGILMQSLDSELAEPIITGLPDWPEPRVSPDGVWALYIANRSAGGNASSADLLRVPITGGGPRLVFTAQSGARIRCAKAPTTLCIISEQSFDNKQLILTAFDPLAGRGRQLTKLDGQLSASYSWDLSPDATRVAFVRSAEGPIDIVSLKGEPPRKLNPRDWSTVTSLAWSADGKGLFITGLVNGVMTLMLIDLDGQRHLLWSPRDAGGHLAMGAPSPDGRHVAICRENFSGNIWMIEDF